jgi:hypothetical protein
MPRRIAELACQAAAMICSRPPATSRERVSDQVISWSGGKVTLPLDGEDVAILELRN